MNRSDVFRHPFVNILLFCGSVVCCNSARAQQVPSCENVQNPQVGTVCYVSAPVSFRRVEREGCDEANVFVERVSPNAFFTGSSSLDEDSRINVTGPNVSFVSGSGDIRYEQLVTEKITQLNETKNRLEGKAAACSGSVCGDIRNQLDSINRTINEFDNSRRLTIQMGKNEKAHISVKGCVSCSARLPFGGSCIAYSAGASWQGRVRLYQRFTKMPESSLQSQTASLIQRANGISSSQPSGPPTSGLRRDVWIVNNCSIPTNFALGVLEPDGNWRTYGVWALQPRAVQPLGNTRGGIVATTQNLLYVWARAFVPNGGTFNWTGPTQMLVNNQPFQMTAFNSTPDNFGRYIIQLDCPQPFS
jgi:hypothetical protein